MLAGDTLWDIAQNYGVTVDVLLAANPQITNRSLIRPGDRITIPPRAIDLGTPDGPPSFAEDINDAGQVVGFIEPAVGPHHAFLWEDGEMTNLEGWGLASGDATGINGSGQVVGFNVPGLDYRAFVWRDGVMQYLPTPGNAASQARDINDLGQVVGNVGTASALLPVWWPDGSMIELATLGGARSAASAVNNQGQIVGSSETGSSEHAVLWQDRVITDLGTLGGARSNAWDINERGQIVGHSQTPAGEWHAALWQDGSVTDLGTLGGADSFASAINDCGQVVGWSQTTTGREHAFLWQNGAMVDLGTAGGLESTAYAINEWGQVAGSSFPETVESSPLRTGQAVMWTPTLPRIALNTPVAGATVVQNDPSTGCPPNATRGYGLAVTFAWNPLPVEGVSGYRLVVRRIGALYPALDMRVEAPGWTWMDCNGFIADHNLDDWYWQVTALDGANQVLAVSEQRAFSFLPCRLSDGRTPCTAPG